MQWRKSVKIIGGNETEPSKVAHTKKRVVRSYNISRTASYTHHIHPSLWLLTITSSEILQWEWIYIAETITARGQSPRR